MRKYCFNRFVHGGLALMLLAGLTACDVSSLLGDTRKEAKTAYEEGLRHLGAKEYDAAAQKFIVSSYLAPDESAPRLALCQAYSAKGDLDAARTACEQALVKDKKDPQLFYLLGSIDLIQNQAPKAQTKFEAALKLNPEYGAALAALGAAHVQMGNFEPAVKVLSKARKMDSSNTSILNNLAIALMTLKRCDESEVVLREATALGVNVESLRSTQSIHCAISKVEPVQQADSHMKIASAGVDVSVAAIEGMKLFTTVDGKSFYMDERPATGLAYSKCVDAGVCRRPPYDQYNRLPEYAREPAMSVNYAGADAFCKWKGKRLPTRAEYDAAFADIKWLGCCARGVIPGEWVNDGGGEPNDKIAQVRLQGKALAETTRKRKTGVDSSTVRCAMAAK